MEKISIGRTHQEVGYIPPRNRITEYAQARNFIGRPNSSPKGCQGGTIESKFLQTPISCENRWT